MGHERCVALNASHSQMTKFPSREDPNFRIVSWNLLKVMEGILATNTKQVHVGVEEITDTLTRVKV